MDIEVYGCIYLSKNNEAEGHGIFLHAQVLEKARGTERVTYQTTLL